MKNGVFATCVRAPLALLAAGTIMSLGGCAGTEVDEMYTTNVSLTERNQSLLSEVERLENENELLQDQRSRSTGTMSELRSANADLRSQVDETNATMRDFEGRLANIPLAPLDMDTDRALQQLAAQNPDLISYDPNRGMLRFASDLTFGSGSDQVQDGARSSLESLANVLTSGSASKYEIHIVGHTDSQAISSGTAQRHPTNMHLACHRAISVRRVLVGLGVPADRMQSAGWGEHRPVVANTAKGNTPQNRRVELFLTRSTVAFGAVDESQGFEADRETPTRPQLDVTK